MATQRRRKMPPNSLSPHHLHGGKLSGNAGTSV
jgi:hypothetical protein